MAEARDPLAQECGVVRVLAEKTQRDTKTLAMLALPGSTTSEARRADRIDDYKWISGPITTVHDGHIAHKATAVPRVGSASQQWFSESSGNVLWFSETSQ